jgi:hypothetical protein
MGEIRYRSVLAAADRQRVYTHDGREVRETNRCSSRPAATCFAWLSWKGVDYDEERGTVIEGINALSQSLGDVWAGELLTYQAMEHDH